MKVVVAVAAAALLSHSMRRPLVDDTSWQTSEACHQSFQETIRHFVQQRALRQLQPVGQALPLQSSGFAVQAGVDHFGERKS